jgi:hypothetical protein
MKRTSFLLAISVWGLTLGGCSRPPQVSPANRKLVDGLRTATSSRQISWVDECAKLLEDAKQNGAVTDEEYAEFSRIVTLSREGKWQEAEAETIRLGKAQKPTPEEIERVRAARQSTAR